MIMRDLPSYGVSNLQMHALCHVSVDVESVFYFGNQTDNSGDEVTTAPTGISLPQLFAIRNFRRTSNVSNTALRLRDGSNFENLLFLPHPLYCYFSLDCISFKKSLQTIEFSFP